MIRLLAVLLGVLVVTSLGVSDTMAQMNPAQQKTDQAQPRSMEPKIETMSQKVEGTIKAVQGNMVTLEDGTRLSIPSSVKVAKNQLKPGVQISAEYEEKGGQKVATSVQIKG